MRLAGLMDKRSEGRNKKEETDDLNNSLTLNQKEFDKAFPNDELIVYGDQDNEQDESSLLNSNLLKLLDDEPSYMKGSTLETTQKSPLGKLGREDQMSYIPPKQEIKAEPIRVFRTQRETATLKEIGIFPKDLELIQDHKNIPKTTNEISEPKRKSKLSRQNSKESLTSKKSGRSIRSRKQSKDVPLPNNPPLKKTLASVMGSMSRPNLDKATPPSLLSTPLENSPMFTNKTVKELKLAEKCSPSHTRSSLMNGQQQNSFLTSSPQVANFHLPLERCELPERTQETSKRIAHIMEILKTPVGASSKEQDQGFDSIGDAEKLTRDTPSSKNGTSINQQRVDTLYSEDGSFIGQQYNGSLLASLIETNSPKKAYTPRLENYRPFTLSSVLSKKTRDFEN